ncbi:1-deoxy-D-xylulose-5-phosphate reductoisomerase [Pelagibacteraceae bacterium]|nr:1-deoxy-D-xylulose-5-phosphate reductoisomerase [Pelagibacteraceae bacterium]
MKKSISILGSTGSIGESALKIIGIKKNLFSIHTLVANSNYNKICKQVEKLKPKNFVIFNNNIFTKIKKKYKKKKINFYNNYEFLKKINKKIDVTISGIPGLAGLEPTIIFTSKSKKMLIANKEAIICGWEILKKISLKEKTEIIPIDSEHFSIKNLLEKYNDNDVETIFITASGGPFLYKSLSSFKNIKPKDAIKHPKWKMGKKISVDSATLMNKILEIIEAQKIFPFNRNKFKIIIHPQSLVHAIVKFKNGITKLLYHEPNMVIPIANALFDYNTKISNFLRVEKKNFNIKNLEFYAVDAARFPVIKLIPKMNKHVSTPIIINAANEILIDQFLKKNISFSSINKYLFKVLRHYNYKKYAIKPASSLNNIIIIDKWSRKTTLEFINKK